MGLRHRLGTERRKGRPHVIGQGIGLKSPWHVLRDRGLPEVTLRLIHRATGILGATESFHHGLRSLGAWPFIGCAERASNP